MFIQVLWLSAIQQVVLRLSALVCGVGWQLDCCHHSQDDIPSGMYVLVVVFFLRG